MTNPISVFLIDDHTIFSQSLGSYVSTRPDFLWKGSTNGSGRSVQQVLQIQPRILLLDFHLQDKNGLEILQELRAKGFRQLVILLTMNRETVVREAAKHQGANGFVSKETDGEFFLAGLKQLASGEIDYLEILAASARVSSNPFGLTAQEKLIAELVCSGFNSEEIAKKLLISVHTVHTHRRRILDKTGAANFMQVCQKLA